MTGRLNGKLAVVSGFASGIGRETALVFAREGATVLGVDINTGAARATVDTATTEGLKIEDLSPVDMFRPDAVGSLMDHVGDIYGGIDVLVNAAAVTVMAPLDEMTPEDFRRTLTGEIESVFLATRSAWPYLTARGGSIINFASTNSHQAVDRIPGIAHTAGKGGVLAMTRQIAFEGARHGVRANTISPGLIATNETQPFIDVPENLDSVLQNSMIQRVGQPIDVAHACVFLASDESSFVTAADLRVDGGLTAR